MDLFILLTKITKQLKILIKTSIKNCYPYRNNEAARTISICIYSK